MCICIYIQAAGVDLEALLCMHICIYIQAAGVDLKALLAALPKGGRPPPRRRWTCSACAVRLDASYPVVVAS